MDTAFKRRWEFKYIGIDDEEGKVDGYIVPVGNTGRQIAWNELRKAINEKLIDVKVNEDKLLGPFFIAPSTLGEPEKFNDVFKSKVLLYLFEDAAKTKKSTFFTNAVSTYSDLCKLYDSEGPESVIDGIV